MRPRRLAGQLRRWFILLCLLTVLLSFLAVKLNKQRNTAPSPQYLLRDDGGRICLFSADGSEELRKYDILTRLLPEGDVEALRTGVPVYTEDELLRLVEDYGG